MSAEPALSPTDVPLLTRTAEAVEAARALTDLARQRLSARVTIDGRVSGSELEKA